MKKTYKLNRRKSNYNKGVGGMHLSVIKSELKNALGGNTSIIVQDLSTKNRMGKPYGMLNHIVNKLAENTDDSIINAKIKKLEQNIKEISSILGNKITKDETKLNKIFTLMDGKLEVVPIKQKCPSGRHDLARCNDAELCEKQRSRWAPNR